MLKDYTPLTPQTRSSHRLARFISQVEDDLQVQLMGLEADLQQMMAGLHPEAATHAAVIQQQLDRLQQLIAAARHGQYPPDDDRRPG
ncbi:MAG: hypothetical protein MUE40_19040 [Anaerolineae bacterium]|nr:hypothetical protein [Anaerolineae bacterium]